MSQRAEIAAQAAAYYAEKLRQYGATPRGVDWNSPESQAVRFRQVCRVLEDPVGEGSANRPIRLLDFGCGYGALAQYLAARDGTGRASEFRESEPETLAPPAIEYWGYDAAPEMLEAARQFVGQLPGRISARFAADLRQLPPIDYVVASGLFNVRQEVDDASWRQYVLDTLAEFHRLSQRGFAFNVLTRYSDPERMRPDLHYADPLELFDYCKRFFSRDVALLHDYGLYEFTILVRKPA